MSVLRRFLTVLAWMGCIAAVIAYFAIQQPVRKIITQHNGDVSPGNLHYEASKPEIDQQLESLTTPKSEVHIDALPAEAVPLPVPSILTTRKSDITRRKPSIVRHNPLRMIVANNGATGKSPSSRDDSKRRKQGGRKSAGNSPTRGEGPQGRKKTSEVAKVNQTAIDNYFTAEKVKCLKQDKEDAIASAGKTKQPFCPCISPHLKGRLIIDQTSNYSLNDIRQSGHTDVQPGGEWWPPGCRARTRLAIVIPFRDRMNHLKIFLKHMLPVLKRQLTHFRIFIVEQNEPAMFNKAAMMNIGFLEAMKQFKFNCVLFHDVDILMEDDRSLLNCGDTPQHYAISLDRWNYSLIYETVFGAVVTMRPKMFVSINGFSNFFFGWGGEDDDMSTRVRTVLKKFVRPPMDLGRYTAIVHKRDSANAVNPDRKLIMKKQESKYKEDGINSVKYTVKQLLKKPLYTWILADLHVTGLPYPNYTTFSYTSADSVTCSHDDGITSPKYLSLVTCKYECDLLDSDCLGFLHRDLDEWKECRLINRNCSGLATRRQGSHAAYLKRPLTLPIPRS